MPEKRHLRHAGTAVEEEERRELAVAAANHHPLVESSKAKSVDFGDAARDNVPGVITEGSRRP
jgi:hypothetical protein